jgi:hypothetical protein
MRHYDGVAEPDVEWNALKLLTPPGLEVPLAIVTSGLSTDQRLHMDSTTRAPSDIDGKLPVSLLPRTLMVLCRSGSTLDILSG